MSVLITEQDYYDLAFECFTNANRDNVTHIECFIDPQAHTDRGVSLKTVFAGIDRAIVDAKLQFGMTVSTIVCFLRHLGQDPALRAFDSLMEHRHSFIGIGLDSSELGFPPSIFKDLYRRAEKEKLFLVAHAGEEGPVDYVWEAIDILGVDRIDHGNTILNDKDLIKRVIKDDLAITMCPLSNKCLQVSTLGNNPALKLLEKGVKVTINSDDPAYFGGYLNDNYKQLSQSLSLTEEHLNKLIKNSLDARFVL